MDVAVWLRQLGLGTYAETFEAHDIDASVLPDITAEDLIDLGITSVGHRRKLLAAIAGLRAAAPQPTAEPTRAPERRHLTVMFVDLARSTQLSQRLDPEVMAGLLRAYHNLVAGEISRFEGFTAKLMGDGVLAYFGWPRTHEDEAERAARAGLAIVQAVRGLSVPKAGPLACRVGIATGLVVVGDRIGEASAREEAVIGETPNLAARLQQLAEAHGVVVSAGTRRLLPDSLKIVPLGPRRLRGLAGRVEAFAVTGERPASTRFEARSGATYLPMFGRDQELALLLERWTRAKAGEGQAVLLVGEAGIGKSRICQALVDALATDPFIRIRYQCSPYHADSPFWPAIQQLRHAIDVDADDSPDSVLDRLEALLGQGLDNPSSAAPYIAALIGIDGTGRYGHLDVTAEARRNQTLQILGDQLAGLARKAPVLVLVEDAHWIDPTTRELIEQAIETIPEVPALFLMTTRPDNQPALAAHPHVTRLTLNRLARDGAAAIVSRISAGQPLPSDVLETILARTDGVPLFVEELTKAVVETGLPAVPSSLHDSLMARLDRGAEIKEIAQVAACIGRTFDHDLLFEIAGRTSDELAAGLDELAAAELVFRRGRAPTASYAFKHALVRDAAYESLLVSRRREVHAAIVRALERRADAAPELVAHHAIHAGLNAQAVGLLRLAGERALAAHANREALAHLRQAMQVNGTEPAGPLRDATELALLQGLAPATRAINGYASDETLAVYRRAYELNGDRGSPYDRLMLIYGIWGVYFVRCELAATLEWAERGWDIVATESEPEPRILAGRLLGESLWAMGRFDEALGWIERALALAPAVGPLNDLRFSNDHLVTLRVFESWTLVPRGEPDRARAAAAAGLRRAKTLAHPVTLSLALSGAGHVAMMLGDVTGVANLARHGIAVAAEHGVSTFGQWSRFQHGWAGYWSGQRASGLELMEAAFAETEATATILFRPLLLDQYAEALAREGRLEEAGHCLEKAVDVIRVTGERFYEAEVQRRRGRLFAAMGEHERASEAFLASLDVASSQNASLWELRVARDLAAHLMDAGKPRQAHEILAPVYSKLSGRARSIDLDEAERILARISAHQQV